MSVLWQNAVRVNLIRLCWDFESNQGYFFPPDWTREVRRDAAANASSTNHVNTGLTFQHYLPGLLLRKKDKGGEKNIVFSVCLFFSSYFVAKQRLHPQAAASLLFLFFLLWFVFCLFSSSSAVLLMQLIICVIHFSRCNWQVAPQAFLCPETLEIYFCLPIAKLLQNIFISSFVGIVWKNIVFLELTAGPFGSHHCDCLLDFSTNFTLQCGPSVNSLYLSYFHWLSN